MVEANDCKRPIRCTSCAMWLFMCQGRKGDRIRDVVELAKIVEEQVLLE